MQPLTEKTLSNFGIREKFSFAACDYDAHAVIQRQSAIDMIRAYNLYFISANRIIDLGSGTGMIARLATFEGRQWVNLDISMNMLSESEKHLKSSKYVSVCGDLCHLPMSDSSVDVVLSNMALQWCSDLPLCVNEIYRVLKPKGQAFLSIMLDESFSALKKAWSRTSHEAKLQRLPSKNDWLKAFERQFDTVNQVATYVDNSVSLIEMLKGIKNVGASYYQPKQKSLSKSELRQLETHWHDLHRHHYFLDYSILRLAITKK